MGFWKNCNNMGLSEIMIFAYFCPIYLAISMGKWSSAIIFLGCFSHNCQTNPFQKCSNLRCRILVSPLYASWATETCLWISTTALRGKHISGQESNAMRVPRAFLVPKSTKILKNGLLNWLPQLWATWFLHIWTSAAWHDIAVYIIFSTCPAPRNIVLSRHMFLASETPKTKTTNPLCVGLYVNVQGNMMAPYVLINLQIVGFDSQSCAPVWAKMSFRQCHTNIRTYITWRDVTWHDMTWHYIIWYIYIYVILYHIILK